MSIASVKLVITNREGDNITLTEAEAADLLSFLNGEDVPADPVEVTYERPTVVFDYKSGDAWGTKSKKRLVVPVTIKQGQNGILLVGLELVRDGLAHITSDGQADPKIKSYRMERIQNLTEGNPVTWRRAYDSVAPSRGVA